MNIFDSYIDGAQELPERERERFYRAVIEFLRYGREPNLPSGSARGMFVMIRPSLELSQARSKAGKTKSKTISSPKSKDASNENQNDDQKEIKQPIKTESNDESKRVTKGKGNSNKEPSPTDVGDGKKAASRFHPPSAVQVAEYAKSRGYSNFEAERFCDFYASKGWMVGKSPMKDWQAAVRNWVARNNDKGLTSNARAYDPGAYAEYA